MYYAYLNYCVDKLYYPIYVLLQKPNKKACEREIVFFKKGDANTWLLYFHNLTTKNNMMQFHK